MNEKRRANVVLVTGGSSGIGAAVCRHAAAGGWHVLIGYSSGRERAEAVAAEITDRNGECTVLHLPLHDDERIEFAIDEVTAAGLMPDAVVLSACPPPSVKSFTKTGRADFMPQFDINVIGNHRLICCLWKSSFRRRRAGHIVGLLTTALGPPPLSHLVSYTVAKAGLLVLLQSACAQFERADLRVTAVSPGFTDTPMLESFEDLLIARVRDKSSGEQLLDPNDVAKVILDALLDPPPPGMVDQVFM